GFLVVNTSLVNFV
ncbi:hypothetical protein HID58_063936, partial [Brassica napus]